MKRSITLDIFCCTVVFCLLSFVRSVHASYVLPYPSYMPGNTLYKVSRLIDSVKQYWYWGNLAQVKYYLGLSDKYLVETKTLFEYKQYALGVDALTRSTEAFQKLPDLVVAGQKEGKDMAPSITLIGEAAGEHKRVLEYMKDESPSQFRWTPEKTSPSDLFLHQDIEKALSVRETVFLEVQKKSN